MKSYRPPPLLAQEFAAKLATKLFTNGSDCATVASLYADTLAGTLGLTDRLVYNFCEWGDDEMEMLAKVLPMAVRVTRLYLHGNPRIGARGLRALAAAIAEGAAPKLAFISGLDSLSDPADELRAVCEQHGITCDMAVPGSWYLGREESYIDHDVDEPDC